MDVEKRQLSAEKLKKPEWIDLVERESAERERHAAEEEKLQKIHVCASPTIIFSHCLCSCFIPAMLTSPVLQPETSTPCTQLEELRALTQPVTIAAKVSLLSATSMAAG